MNETGYVGDSSGAKVRPPIVWALAIALGLTLNWLYPLPFLPAALPAAWFGGLVFLFGFALFVWAVMTFSRAGTNIPTTEPTTTIVADGPYRFSRNPIYLAMFLGLIGFAIGFNSLWLLIALVPFVLIIRYAVIAHEEAYLEHKFGEGYLGYKARVRRWI